MAFVIVRAPLGLSGPHRQQGLRAVQSLNLALFIHAKPTACSGGFMYKPTMSRTFSMSCGSGDSLKVSLRCGCNPKACQIRLTVIRLSPVALANSRVDQWVCPRGVLSTL